MSKCLFIPSQCSTTYRERKNVASLWAQSEHIFTFLSLFHAISCCFFPASPVICTMCNVRGQLSADTMYTDLWKMKLTTSTLFIRLKCCGSIFYFFWCKVELRRCLYGECDELTHLCGGALAVCTQQLADLFCLNRDDMFWISNLSAYVDTLHMLFSVVLMGGKDSENIFPDPILSRCSTYLRKQHEESNEMAAQHNKPTEIHEHLMRFSIQPYQLKSESWNMSFPFSGRKWLRVFLRSSFQYLKAAQSDFWGIEAIRYWNWMCIAAHIGAVEAETLGNVR